MDRILRRRAILPLVVAVVGMHRAAAVVAEVMRAAVVVARTTETEDNSVLGWFRFRMGCFALRGGPFCLLGD